MHNYRADYWYYILYTVLDWVHDSTTQLACMIHERRGAQTEGLAAIQWPGNGRSSGNTVMFLRPYICSMQSGNLAQSADCTVQSADCMVAVQSADCAATVSMNYVHVCALER